MLAHHFGIAHISMGERLRHEVAGETPIGKQIKEHLDKGEFVPTELTNKIIARFLRQTHKGFIIDGYPRTEEQAQFLDMTTKIDHVLLIKISDKTAIERIGGRRECANGHDFHVSHNPPKKEGICDECGLPLRKREDDTSVAIMTRLAQYHRETEPMLKHYKEKIIEIDGSQSIPQVHQEILKKLKEHQPHR